MKSHRLIPFALGAALIATAALATSIRGGPDVPRGRPGHAPHGSPQSGRTDPDMKRPLLWLIAAQNADGGWGEGVKTQDADVATTSISGLALLRMGHSGSRGEYQESTRRAVDYIVRAVERTPETEVAINAAGTLPQRKLGRNIDTYIAAQFLAEVLPTMPRRSRGRVESALAGCVRRIERSQGSDGSYAKDGWAPLLSSAFASGGLYAARAAGAKVSNEKLAKGEKNLLNQYDSKSDGYKAGENAGVPLYSMAASAGAAARAQSSVPSVQLRPEERKQADDAARAASRGMKNEQMMRGFGNYGGEEHVSFMMTAEAKATQGGAEWVEFRKNIRVRLAQIQREDGTWRGDHCITSTTFCTAASLITLVMEPKGGSKAS